MPQTVDEINQFQSATVCPSCQKPFTAKNNRVRHHDHLSGKFLNVLCNNCNLQTKYGKRKRPSNKGGDENEFTVAVVLHNLAGYDSHHIIKYFRTRFVEYTDKDGNICQNNIENVIPCTNERFISFSIGKFRFIDSFKFLSSSLDNLTSVLLKSGREHFPNTIKHLGNSDTVFHKGVFPYEYFTDESVFNLTELPPKTAFHSNLNETDITDDDYASAQEAWRTFNCKTFKDYHDHYLTSDV